jgi:gamma-glutamylcysteine synthetase
MAIELSGENPGAARVLCARVAAVAWAVFGILISKAALDAVSKRSNESTRRRTAAQRRALSVIKTFTQIAASRIEQSSERRSRIRSALAVCLGPRNENRLRHTLIKRHR